MEASILDFLAFLTFFVKSLSLSALADTSSLTGVFFQIGMPMNIGTSSLSDHLFDPALPFRCRKESFRLTGFFSVTYLNIAPPGNPGDQD